jgi:hypothetical protein
MEHQDQLIGTIRWQQRGFARLGCPFYDALSSELIADVQAGGPAGRMLAPFAAEPLESAYVLRLLAGLHGLALSGQAPALARHFPSAGGDGDARAAMAVIRPVLEDPPPEVTGYLDHPPQTNEVGRAAALASGLAYLAGQARLPLRLREIGASAGLNLRLDAYWYEQDGAGWGNPASPVRFTGLWHGASTLFAARPRILDRRGCDRNPLDVTTSAGAIRLLSYVWPQPAARFARARDAIALARAQPVTIDRADAAQWLPGQLQARPPGTVLVIYHSVVWQYLGQTGQDQIRAQLAAAGITATPQMPLAWLRLEPHQHTYLPAELRLTLWNGQTGEPKHRLLATTDFHGGTLHWLAGQHR